MESTELLILICGQVWSRIAICGQLFWHTVSIVAVSGKEIEMQFQTENDTQRRKPIFTRISSEHQDEKSLDDQELHVIDYLRNTRSEGSADFRKGDGDAI